MAFKKAINTLKTKYFKKFVLIRSSTKSNLISKTFRIDIIFGYILFISKAPFVFTMPLHCERFHLKNSTHFITKSVSAHAQNRPL